MEFHPDAEDPVLGQSQSNHQLPKSAPAVRDDISDSSTSKATASIQDVTTRLLDFLSDANNETLGACLIGLAAATYLALGRVGLVLIGILVGVVLHATWENSGDEAGEDAIAKDTKRKELGLDILERVLDWRDRKSKDQTNDLTNGDDIDVNLSAHKTLDYSSFRPETAQALTCFTDAIIRDYVTWWYAPIIPNDRSFAAASRQTITAFFLSISSHVSRKRPADTFLDFLTNSASIVIVFLGELSAALSASSITSTTPEDTIGQYLDSNPESNLANILDDGNQEKKLRMVAEDILQNFLDTKAYNCEPARVFLREILAGCVLEMTVQTCCKPEWINGWIVQLLEDGEPELLNAIDAGMGRDENVDASNSQGKDSTDTGKGDGKQHKKRVSKAEEAMEEAMKEAQRLNQLIAEEDARKEALNTASGQSPNSSLGTTKNGDSSTTSLTPRPEAQDETSAATVGQSNQPDFISFDQLVPHKEPTALQTPPLDSQAPNKSTQSATLTLYNANISIFDDSGPNDKGQVRSKPTTEYLLQIEPSSSSHPGWMIARKYVDFEKLHEVLRRISVVSGVTSFTKQHADLPPWKGRTKWVLRRELEVYLRDALEFRQLAESEGMKRFLEKDTGLAASSPGESKKASGPGMGWANPTSFETVGKGVMDGLASAPKVAAGGGKALFGGVTGVLGGVGSLAPKRSSTAPNANGMQKSASLSETSLPPSRDGRDGLSSGPYTSSADRPVKPDPDHDSYSYDIAEVHSSRSSINGKSSSDNSGTLSAFGTPQSVVSAEGGEIHLPPPPSDITDDYGSASTPTRAAKASSTKQSSPNPSSTDPANPSSKKTAPPLTEQETRVAVELLFAVINELYTLSSAWNIRRTLLTAAKTFLLRPGNPNLEAIRALLQDSVIAANTSDAGVAAHLRTLTANTLPTEAELKAWPPPPTDAEKARLAAKARRLLVERGMPKALTSVMGAAASGEALGRVFDCLQVERVARGLMFGLLLQAVRAMTQ